jgi:micrococcal nuclease
MKKLLALLFIVPSLALAKGTVTYDIEVTRVLDGDTIEYKADFLPAPLKPVLKIRVLGIDTPEKGHRAQCPEEAALALKASALTKQAVKEAKSIQLQLEGWDKYGGRVLGYVLIDGKNLGDMLIAQGLARPYDGGTKSSWCK